LPFLNSAYLLIVPPVVSWFATLPYLILPAGWMPAVKQTPNPALRPQHGPNVQPRQTSRSIEPLRSFSKLQEEKPMDISQRIQRESVCCCYMYMSVWCLKSVFK